MKRLNSNAELMSRKIRCSLVFLPSIPELGIRDKDSIIDNIVPNVLRKYLSN